MGQPASHEGDSAIIVNLSEAAMHMYSAGIDALPFPEDKKFHKRADVVLSGLRKLRASLAEAASTARPSSGVIVALSNVRRRYDKLMEHAATAPGSTLGQQLYVARIHADLSAHEVANGAGLSADFLDELEAGATPSEEEATKVKSALVALGWTADGQVDDHQELAAPVEPHVNGWDESLVPDTVGT